MMPPSGRQATVYSARPSVSWPTSLVTRRCTACGGARPAEVHLAHVRDVEHADRAAGGLVLLDDARRVADRHHPAAEVDQLGAQPAVRLVERGLAGWGGSSSGRGHRAAPSW